MRSCGTNWVTSMISSKERARQHALACHDFPRICGIGTNTSCSAISVSSSVICGTTKGGRVELLFAVRERAAPPCFAAPRHEMAAEALGAEAGVFEPVNRLVEHLQLFLLLHLFFPLSLLLSHPKVVKGGHGRHLMSAQRG